MKIKDMIKQTILYRYLSPLYALAKAYLLYQYDYYRFVRYSGLISNSGASVEARINTLSHAIERGLSLKEPRPHFGKEKIGELHALMQNTSLDSDCIACAASSLYTYSDVFQNHGLKECLRKYPYNAQGGVIEIDKSTIQKMAGMPFDVFSKNRHSIRNFSNKEIEPDLIEKAISIAQKAPSACNRQAARVYTIMKKELILEVLGSQGGANGFLELVNKLFVITSDSRSYLYANERNLAYIDASMFGMSLLYSLHFLGLGACPLMWANSPKMDGRVRDIAEIDNHHQIILLIAVGHLPDTLTVPKSPRMPIEKIYHRR